MRVFPVGEPPQSAFPIEKRRRKRLFIISSFLRHHRILPEPPIVSPSLTSLLRSLFDVLTSIKELRTMTG